MYGVARRQTTWTKRRKKRFSTINEPIAIVLIKKFRRKSHEQKNEFRNEFFFRLLFTITTKAKWGSMKMNTFPSFKPINVNYRKKKLMIARVFFSLVGSAKIQETKTENDKNQTTITTNWLTAIKIGLKFNYIVL